jgi:hypothetical protein
MSMRPDLHSRYAFLPPSGPDKGNAETAWELGSNIISGVQQLAELVASKEIITEESPWEARMCSYDSDQLPTITDDATAIAENYTMYQAGAAEGRRTFEFDRPLFHSALGAAQLRLEIEAPKAASQDDYAYKLTTYTPRTAPEVIPEAFDEAEYNHILALMAEGDGEKLNAFLDRVPELAPEGPSPLPLIAFQDIHSQFSFSWLRREAQRTPLIQTVTFRPIPAHESLTRVATPVNADAARMERAYAPDTLPKLNQSQALARTLGAHNLVHHNLALTLRHLAA